MVVSQLYWLWTILVSSCSVRACTPFHCRTTDLQTHDIRTVEQILVHELIEVTQTPVESVSEEDT